MQDLINYTVELIRANVINVETVVTRREGKWALLKPIAGMPANTVFQTEQEFHERLATGLVRQYQSGSVRAAS